MSKYVFEGLIKVDYEDSKQAAIGQVDGYDNKDPTLFIRIQGWDETRQHPTLSNIDGGIVRVTVEVLEYPLKKS